MRSLLSLATLPLLALAAPPSSPTITRIVFSGSGCPNDSGSVKTDSATLSDTAGVSFTETAKEVTAGSRMYGNVDGDLLYAFDMAAVGQELQPHTWARLQRA